MPTFTRVYRPMDDFVERKGRLLDYLLALHGETYSQNSLRQFGGYYTARELKALLFENKLAFLKDVIALGRERAGAFDDTQPCWGQGGNTSGLQRRVAQEGVPTGRRFPRRHVEALSPERCTAHASRR